MIEVLRLFYQEKVLDQHRSTCVCLERVFVVGDDGAALVGHLRMGAAGNLVDLPTGWCFLPRGGDGDGGSGNHFLCF